MGIPQFYKKIKKIYPDCITEDTKYLNNTNYDYVIFDFLSLIYSVYNLLSSDINYFIHILYYARYLAVENNLTLFYKHNKIYYPKVLQSIMRKHITYFKNLYGSELNTLFRSISDLNLEVINKLLNVDFNTEKLLIKVLIITVIQHVKKIVHHHMPTVKDKYNKTWIFFDGIPTLAKIKEQLIRRLYPVVMKNIKKNLLTSSTKIEAELQKQLLSESPPPIGLNKPIVNLIHKVLSKIEHPVKGKFNINPLNAFKEAEHQIIDYLVLNNNTFKDKQILLISPDADLILLSIIMYTKQINVDILKIIMETNNNTTEQYNYKPLNNYLVYGYIYPIKFLKAVKLHTIQEYLDFSFILLLLGDDFLPIIPTLTINSLEHILNIYISTKLPIINITDMSINYSNFIILLNNLKHIKYHSHIHKNQLASEILGLRKTKKFLLYSLYNKSSKSKYNLTKSYTFDKIHYLSKGVYVNNNKLELLITNEEKSKSDENIYDKVSNYLEGCKFIFDIYIQNKMENYHWYYKYETAPTLVEISNITSAISFEEVVNMFDYTKTKLDTYLNFTTYQYYIDYLKYVNFKYILEKFNVSNITIDNYNILLEKYCTYKNVPKIFNFDKSKKYINKCFDVLIDKIPTEFLVK